MFFIHVVETALSVLGRNRLVSDIASGQKIWVKWLFHTKSWQLLIDHIVFASKSAQA